MDDENRAQAFRTAVLLGCLSDDEKVRAIAQNILNATLNEARRRFQLLHPEVGDAEMNIIEKRWEVFAYDELLNGR